MSLTVSKFIFSIRLQKILHSEKVDQSCWIRIWYRIELEAMFTNTLGSDFYALKLSKSTLLCGESQTKALEANAIHNMDFKSQALKIETPIRIESNQKNLMPWLISDAEACNKKQPHFISYNQRGSSVVPVPNLT